MDSYRGHHVQSQSDEQRAARASPRIDNVRLLQGQLFIEEREIGKQTNNLLTRRQRCDQVLAQPGREVQRGDKHGHDPRVDESTATTSGNCC